MQTIKKGERIENSRKTIPSNMLARMKRAEDSAWQVSPVAGRLWEGGARLGLAVRMGKIAD
jgi:hypothetical protein